MRINRLRLRVPTPALIIACLALFAALGGSTYAATHTSASHKIHFTNATFKNGWANSSSVDGPAGYAKDSLGVVHLRGLIRHGSSGTTAFVLPKSLRPKHDLYLLVYLAGGNFGPLEIHPNGSVIPFGENPTSGTSLDGVSFVAGQ